MRMRNPFSDEPGDEEKGSGDAAPEGDDAAEADAQETRAGETRESAGPEASEARADDEPSGGADDGPSGGADDPASGEADDQPSGGTDAASSSNGTDGEEQANVTAPSVGPNTVIEREPPEERLDFDKISDTDAMGKDKRREVVGGTYGPTRARVFATFATFIAVVAALCVGFYFLARELDQPPSENPDEAPWSLPEAPQQPPKPIQ
jgi:hypothetical protein